MTVPGPGVKWFAGSGQFAGVAELLKPLLANEFLLYTRTRQCHWNVTGPGFYAYHKFFEDQYSALEGFVDDVAERIRQLGEMSPGTMAEFLALTTLREAAQAGAVQTMVQALLADHTSIIAELRTMIPQVQGTYRDDGTANFLTDLMQKHEKMAWMLRAEMGV